VLAVLAALVGSLVGSLLLAAPAHAAERVITITAEGVTPKVLEVAAGDVITFVNEDTSFGYRAVATSDNWDLDSGPVGLLPGRSYTHPDPITEQGVYTYRVAEGEAYEGSVVRPGPTTPSPGASRQPAASPKPGSTAPSPAAQPAPSPTGGTGTGESPQIGSLGPLPGQEPPAEGSAPAPNIALPELPGESPGPNPQTAPEPETGPTTVAAVPGNLAGPPTSRGYGLPAALAAVLAAGVASLLIRLLLAEPAARRRARGSMTGPQPVATVD
jgi:plastocyanin